MPRLLDAVRLAYLFVYLKLTRSTSTLYVGLIALHRQSILTQVFCQAHAQRYIHILDITDGSMKDCFTWWAFLSRCFACALRLWLWLLHHQYSRGVVRCHHNQAIVFFVWVQPHNALDNFAHKARLTQWHELRTYQQWGSLSQSLIYSH